MLLRTIHRVIAIVVVLITLYLGITGSLIQAIDFRSLYTSPSPFDPNLIAMRSHFAGPPNFRVLATADYVATPFAPNANLRVMLETVVRGARTTLGDTPLKFVELRLIDGHPVGQVRYGEQQLRIDATSGAALAPWTPETNEDDAPASLRATVKHLHRMTTAGDWALWIIVVVSIALVALIVTGVILYAKLLKPRWRMGRTNPFWKAGGWWRALHRSIAIAAAILLSIQTFSGAFLAIDDVGFAMYNNRHHTVMPSGQIAPGTLAFDASSPLSDHALPGMLDATLAAYRAAMPGVPLRVVRLRNYAGIPQGVVITGGSEAQQLVFDTATGQRLGLTELGYPPTGFPFGWQAHQIAKKIHRGDFFGMTGRIMSLLAGLSMIYLSVSAIFMYWTMWRKRRSQGRRGFIWI